MKETINLEPIYPRMPYLPLSHQVIQITTTQALRQPALNPNTPMIRFPDVRLPFNTTTRPRQTLDIVLGRTFTGWRLIEEAANLESLYSLRQYLVPGHLMILLTTTKALDLATARPAALL